MFLQWINQILGCLDSPLIDVISPLLIRLCQVYPKAIQFPLKIFMERNVYKNEECETFLKTKLVPLISDIYIDMFIKAISNVCCPFTQLLEYINDVQESIKTNNLSLIILVFEIMLKNCFITKENQQFKGKEFKTLDIFKNELESIFDKLKSSYSNLNDVCMALITIKKQIDTHKNEYYNRKLSTNLINYCPWLALYSNHNIDTIEIPGQYCGTRKPNIDNHITITSFKPNVQVIFSMRNPIKITMIGNNGKKYSFLIKFGEDLRQDQRIQQLHKVINDTLLNNSYCCERQLSLSNYIVFPITTKLGMIEWINNTVTLKDFICESFPGGKDSGIEQLHSKVVEHYRWLSEKSDSLNKLTVYTQATINYNSMVTVAKFKQLVQSIPADILRKSLLNLCHYAEMYICLRSKFITSFSVLSICHWLLGIGDRHLDNTIVSTKTGFCTGIDFNFAFHTATSIQVIPELIPFRMSPHIVSLMAPLNLTGFIRETMVHTLKTLIDNQEMILSVMQVFINDPTADWAKIAKTETLRINGEFDSKEIQWFPKQKILSGKDKLNGINPIEILCRELEISCIPNDYKKALLNILKSDSQNNIFKRSKLQKCNITHNQQIDCLLDIATDHQILCLAYSGLQLWV
uniref:DNA-dependent protein kinase catalytic subunit n=2 Tax=Melanaphis sacchari TaxID=742174 RepID=A0A2H8U1F2_9HEMI